MARYVDEGVDVLVVTCTGGERGSILNPALRTAQTSRPTSAEIRRDEMNRAREILGVRQDWLGFVDSGLPEGDPLPPLPEGCFALAPVEEAAVGWSGRCARSVRTSSHLRRERRLPAPRPHPHPQDLDRRLRGGRRPRRVPRRGRAVAAAQALLRCRLQSGALRGPARGDAGAGLESPFEEWLKRWEEMTEKFRAPRSPPASRGRLVRAARRSTARARDPGRPQRLVLRVPWRSSARRGPPRTSNWPDRWSIRRSLRTTCSPASAGDQHDGGARGSCGRPGA